MFALKFSRELFFVAVLLFSVPLISSAGAGDGSGGSTDAASSLGFAANDGFYGNNTQGTVGTSDAEAAAGVGGSDGNSFSMSFSSTHSVTATQVDALSKMTSRVANSFKNALDALNSRFTAPPAQTYAPPSTTNANKDQSRLGTPTSPPSTPSTPTTADASRFGPTDISPVDFSPLGEPDPGRFGYGEEMGPSAADNPGGFGNPGTGNPGGGNPGTGNPGGGNPGGGLGGGNNGGGLGGGNPGGGNNGGGLGGGNPGGGNPGGPGYGDNSNSNPDNNWYTTVTNLAQGLQSAYSVINPAMGLIGGTAQIGAYTVLNNPTVYRRTPQYTNFSDLAQINSSSTIRLIARADRTDDWQIEETVDPNVASSSVRLLTTREEMDAWYTGRSEGVNSIVLEAKVVGSDGRVIVNWVTIPFGALNIPKAAQLYLRWNADSYTQCLAFLNDNGRYTFQTKDRSMKRGNTESEQYDIPEVTGAYSIQCARQTNMGTIVDQSKIQVIVGN